MKIELVKRQDRWDLYAEDGSKIGSSAPNPMNKLSIKNCEAVANGYDLDELIEDNFKGLRACIEDQDIAEFYISLVKTTVTEILGDKKFSEEDISKAINFGVHVEAGNIDINYKRYGTTENQFIQSLQQTEWDVTFNPDEKDSDGCLILRRK